MTKRELSPHASVAKMIRQHLKAEGIVATVRASRGSAVNVDVSEVLPATFKLIKEFCGRFEMGHFDGMDDSYKFSNRDDSIPQVQYVFVHHEITDATREAAKEYIAAINGIKENEAWRYVEMALNGTWGDFWKNRKPRVRSLNSDMTEV